MKTEVIEKKAANENNKANPVTEEKKEQRFVAGNPVNAEAKKNAEKAPAKPQEETKGTEKADATAAPAAEEEAKSQVAPPVVEAVKPALNLEGTLKLVEELHRRKIQRDKLIETINNLEGFEVELKEEVDETDGNYFQGCSLTIEDDTRRKFTTKNPTIIWTVAQMVNSLCVNKLQEIEAGITLPK